MTSYSQAPPSDTFDQDTLEKAAAISVLSENGESVTFGSLFEKQKTIVVFIRHFGCGVCQAYVEELAKVPKSALDTASTRIVVIGCGDWSLIKSYKENSNFPYEIYAEPTRALHRVLELKSELKGRQGDDPQRKYVPNVAMTTLVSAGRILMNIVNIKKFGNFAQNGGEFIIGPGLNITYGRRMRNSQDHVDVVELMHEAGVNYVEEGEVKAAS